MADYVAHCRSNYFAVKDADKFRRWCDVLGMKAIDVPFSPGARRLPIDSAVPPSRLWGFLVSTGSLPMTRETDEIDRETEVDVLAELAGHLIDGWVAIVVESGHTKLAYVGGWATAVNSQGEMRHVSLRDIYDLAESLGFVATRAED